MHAEASLEAQISISSADGVFVFEPNKHELPKVFRDPSPHASHAIHMGHITGLALSDMFRSFGRKMIEVNVRDFLGDTAINKGMRETIKNEPNRFAAYNNGLTIVCSSVEIEGNEIKSIENPSVVNGGQTTMVIVDEARKGTAVQAVRVPIRVVEITSSDAVDVSLFPSLISRYANTQNNIKTTDQLVNEAPHPKLNEYCVENAERVGWLVLCTSQGYGQDTSFGNGRRVFTLGRTASCDKTSGSHRCIYHVVCVDWPA
jgi:hypothetical protein